MINNETSQIGNSLNQIRAIRIEKINKLRKLGIEPFPARVRRDHEIKEFLDNFEEKKEGNYFICGRVSSIRSYGKLLFWDIKDESGKIQVILMKNIDLHGIDNVPSLNFDQCVELIDVGDFLEINGKLMLSKTQEKSLLANSVRIATKSIRPIPEKLEDTETKQRKRYLDIMINPGVKERFERRSKFWQANRDFLNSKGFIEMNCPILEHTTGGADANPFSTHMDAIDQNFYLRISHELPLKRLIGAGYEKVYDLGARFRNEGFSDEHLPEHMAIEWYWAYADYREGMKMMEEMFRYVAEKTWGKLIFDSKGFTVDFTKDWEVINYADIIGKTFEIDIYNTSKEEIEAKLGEQVENVNRGIDKLWKKIRATIQGPAWLIGEPVFMSPLAKPSQENLLVSERFHPVIAGSELGNGYSELNDPLLQLNNFEEQQAMRDGGDSEAQMLDKDFVEMLEYGMPPTCGWGHSERVFWFLENVSARDGVIFPPMREANLGEDAKNESLNIAHIVLNFTKESNLVEWQKFNTVAHVSASFGARIGKQLFFADEITTQDDRKLKLNIQYAIMIHSSDSESSMKDLINDSESEGLRIFPFTREMLETSDDKKVLSISKTKNFNELEILGVLVYGRKDLADEKVKKFPLID